MHGMMDISEPESFLLDILNFWVWLVSHYSGCFLVLYCIPFEFWIVLILLIIILNLLDFFIFSKNKKIQQKRLHEEALGDKVRENIKKQKKKDEEWRRKFEPIIKDKGFIE